MRKSFFVLLALLITLSGKTEEIPKFKFGKVTKDELKIKTCDIDSGAHAFFFFDKGSSRIEYAQSSGFQIVYQRHCRIKILTSEGYDNAEFKIAYYEPENSTMEESVSKIKAVTYNLENNKIEETKLDRKDIFTEKVNDNWWRKSFTLPNVKEGSVIEVEYYIYSDFIWNLPDWNFQHMIPAKWSILDIGIPEYFHYNRDMKGYISLFSNETSTTRRTISSLNSQSTGDWANRNEISRSSIDYIVENTTMVAKDIPAFKEEPYMDAVNNYISSISFELNYTDFPSQAVRHYTTTWDRICKDLNNDSDFGSQLDASGATRKLVEELNLQNLEDLEKVNKIVNYVKLNTKWNEINSIYSSGANKLLKEGVGSCGEINSLLISMLDAAGFEVLPLVLRTRQSGILPLTRPSLSELNYLVAAVKINNNYIFIDATEDFIPIGLLPVRCVNNKGILLKKDDSFDWVDLTAHSYSKYMVAGQLNLSDTGELEGKLKYRRDGQDALRRRNQLDIEKEEIIKDIESENEGMLVEEFEMENLETPEQILIETMKVSISDKVMVAGNMMYFTPCLSEGFEENPFKLEERQYPIDFAFKFDNTVTFSFVLPEGWDTESLPEPLNIRLQDNSGTFRYSIQKMNNIIIMNQNFSIKKPVYIPAQYNELKEFFRQVVEKQQEQIVLKKI